MDSKDKDDAQEGASGNIREILDLPVARVKRIMKSDADVKNISTEAIICVTKAAELLVEKLGKDTLNLISKENRKNVTYKDLTVVVREDPALDFLEDIIAEKVKFGTLLRQSNV